MKARAIPRPHQPPTRGHNTVSVAQGGTATPGATKQLLPPDKVLKELYIYIYIYARIIYIYIYELYIYIYIYICELYICIYTPDQLRAETTWDVHLHF